MEYNQVHPHAKLSPYIDAYYTVMGGKASAEKILPDGCVDIILNIGDDCRTDNGAFLMNDEKAYLVGPMTQPKEVKMLPETNLIGIRFKPAAFSAFFNFSPLHEISNQTIELDKNLSPDVGKTLTYYDGYLNRFFLERLSEPKQPLTAITEGIKNHTGPLSIKELASKYCTTVKQLERLFSRHAGMTPKEYVNLVRYQHALEMIKANNQARSLLDIAFECGYYDHSHLTNAIKKYTGQVPSQL